MSTDGNKHEHGPLPARRIPSAEVEETYLRTLEANDQVVRVTDEWQGDRSGFPPHVSHVLYPNGDLERIGMS
jgi:hypothetical protein